MKACPTAPRAVVLLLAALSAISPSLGLEEEPPDTSKPKHGFAYLGAFFVTNISSHLSLFHQDLPIGGRIDLSQDLGLVDSVTSPRATIGWHFRRRHVLSFGYYDLSRDGGRTLFDGIELPEPIPGGARIESFVETKLYRLSYTWLFYNDSKVKLGVGGGLFVAGLGAGLKTEETPVTRFVEESVTAPLPVLGARLGYRITPKLEFLANWDWFFVDYKKYRGVISDLQFFVNHDTFKHVGFGAGLNYHTLKLEVDDDEIFWDIDSSYPGILAVMSFRF